MKNTIKARREDLGMSQTVLADRLGVTKSWLSNLESGNITDIAIHKADRIAEALGYKGRNRIFNVFSLGEE